MFAAWIRGEWVEIDADAVRNCQRVGIEVQECDHLPIGAVQQFPKFLDPDYMADSIQREVEAGMAQIARYLAL